MAKLKVLVLLAFLAGLCIVQLQAEENEVNSEEKHILVFGGSGFIGSAAVVRLLGRGYKVHLVNRGNWYWDSEERIKPHVNYVYCDREQNIEEFCPDLMKLLTTVDRFEAVVDFCAFGGHEVNQSVKALDVSTCQTRDRTATPTRAHTHRERERERETERERESLYKLF